MWSEMWRHALLVGRRVSLLALCLRNEMKTILRNLSTSGPRHSWMHSYQIFIGLRDNIDGWHALNKEGTALCPVPHFCSVNIKAMRTNKLQVLKIVGNCKLLYVKLYALTLQGSWIAEIYSLKSGRSISKLLYELFSTSQKMPGPISVLLEVKGGGYGRSLVVAKARSYQREVLNSARSHQMAPLVEDKNWCAYLSM